MSEVRASGSSSSLAVSFADFRVLGRFGVENTRLIVTVVMSAGFLDFCKHQQHLHDHYPHLVCLGARAKLVLSSWTFTRVWVVSHKHAISTEAYLGLQKAR